MLRFAILFVTVTSALTTACDQVFAQQDVVVVVGKSAPALEKFAAEELAAQFRRLFQVKVQITSSPPKQFSRVVFVGSPKTCIPIKLLAGDAWPKLSDQGFVFKHLGDNAQTGLIVGGDTPVATLWAVYELGHHFGIRYMLRDDIYPNTPVKFDLGVNRVVEPVLKTRSYRMINDFALGSESWPLVDQKRMLRQLAKLKFNRVMLSVYPWQPFVHYEFRGKKKSTGKLWYGERLGIPRDAPGRTALVGLKVFENSDFAGKEGYGEMLAAGQKYFAGIVEEAHRLGMTVGVSISPLEFPSEFKQSLAGLVPVRGLNGLTVGPGAKIGLDSEEFRELVATKIKAYLAAYPSLDVLYLTMPEFPEWQVNFEAAWRETRTLAGPRMPAIGKLFDAAQKRSLIASGKRGLNSLKSNIVTLAFLRRLLDDESLLRRPDGRKVELVVSSIDPELHPHLESLLPRNAGVLAFVDYTARRVAENRHYLSTLPAKRVKSSMILTLADDNVGVLSQSTTSRLETIVGEISKRGWDGFSTRHWMLAELDPAMHFLSRVAWDSKVTARAAHDDLFLAITGKKAATDRLWLGFQHIEKATELVDKHQIGFAFPVRGMFMKHYQAAPAPKWWDEVNDHYTKAMIELYRSNDAADPRCQKIVFYWSKRGEYVLEYLAAVKAVREAAIAMKQGDKDKGLEHFEAAIESLYNAIDTLSDVARDPSDRGLIATLINFAYKPLVAEYEKHAERP